MIQNWHKNDFYYNAQKDKINDLDCEHFTTENNQKLVTFIPLINGDNQVNQKKKLRNMHMIKDPCKILKNPLLHDNVFLTSLQKMLWD
jgi:hypothetical protein